MARLVRLPSSGSLYATEASMVSPSKAVWLGFAAACPAVGSVMWWRGTAASAGSPFLPIAGCTTTAIFGPYLLSGCLYASPVGGSAIYQVE